MDIESTPEKSQAIKWLLVAMAVLAALYSGGWFFLSYHLHANIEVWIEQQKQNGTQIQFSAMNRSGFPLAVNVQLIQPNITANRKQATYIWRGEQAVVTMVPWQLRNIHVDLSGPQFVLINKNSVSTVWKGMAKTLSADMRLMSTKKKVVALNIENIIMNSGSTQSNQKSQTVKLHRGQLVLTQSRPQKPSEKTPTLSLAADLNEFEVPKSLPMPLGHRFSKLTLRASVLGPLPKRINARSLLAWRDAGGTIEVERLRMEHGPLQLYSNGAVAVDENLQPVGAFTRFDQTQYRHDGPSGSRCAGKTGQSAK
jgi:hypothetical protein